MRKIFFLIIFLFFCVKFNLTYHPGNNLYYERLYLSEFNITDKSFTISGSYWFDNDCFSSKLRCIPEQYKKYKAAIIKFSIDYDKDYRLKTITRFSNNKKTYIEAYYYFKFINTKIGDLDIEISMYILQKNSNCVNVNKQVKFLLSDLVKINNSEKFAKDVIEKRNCKLMDVTTIDIINTSIFFALPVNVVRFLFFYNIYKKNLTNLVCYYKLDTIKSIIDSLKSDSVNKKSMSNLLKGDCLISIIGDLKLDDNYILLTRFNSIYLELFKYIHENDLQPYIKHIIKDYDSKYDEFNNYIKEINKSEEINTNLLLNQYDFLFNLSNIVYILKIVFNAVKFDYQKRIDIICESFKKVYIENVVVKDFFDYSSEKKEVEKSPFIQKHFGKFIDLYIDEPGI